ncbi:MAG: DnaA regulatory inactivator Hda [Gammaproteobacteria bacterium]|nr:DnaA regulatory inactivator Hda [Gammaproteobacteria bacterium]
MQLPLAIQLNTSLNFENFVCPDDEFFLATLKQFASGTGESVVYLWGAKGCGKTHLLHAVCQHAAATDLSVNYLPLAEMINYPVDVLEGLEDYAIICIDDMNALVAHPEWQQAIFNLYNRVRENKGRMLFSAITSPKDLGLSLNDLVSRMEWGVVFHLRELNDKQKNQAFKMRASLRGLELNDDVADYVLKHFARDSDTLFRLLDHLDRQSLISKRRITIPFIKNVIEQDFPA